MELIQKAGGCEAIRERLFAKARAEADRDAMPEEPAALVHLRRQLATLEDDIATAERRMATERTDARYAAIAKTFDSLVADGFGCASDRRMGLCRSPSPPGERPPRNRLTP